MIDKNKKTCSPKNEKRKAAKNDNKQIKILA
jgi:hypothetical protein